MAARRNHPDLALADRLNWALGSDMCATWECGAVYAWLVGESRGSARSSVEIDTARAAQSATARRGALALACLAVATMRRVSVIAPMRGALMGTTITAHGLTEGERKAREQARILASQASEQAAHQARAHHDRVVALRHVPAVVRSARAFNFDPEAPESEHEAIRSARADMRRGTRYVVDPDTGRTMAAVDSGTYQLATVAESTRAHTFPTAEACLERREGAERIALDAADRAERAGTMASQARTAEGEGAYSGRPTVRRSKRGGRRGRKVAHAG